MPAAPDSIALMRHELRRWLAAAGADEATTYEIAVACGEACTNAVEHAYPPGDEILTLEGTSQGGAVELTVRDQGLWRAPRGGDRARGIELIRRLMDSATVTPGPQGTVVRMRRALPGRVSA
jgi:anti-sigma regulatory factor (Ser/Thr protein kinase)